MIISDLEVREWTDSLCQHLMIIHFMFLQEHNQNPKTKD